MQSQLLDADLVVPCRRCCTGPGGWQLWPKAGYWVRDPTALSAQQCAFPSSERCLGWSTVNGSVVCGAGYDPASPLCGSCLPGWYPDASGCFPCPQRPNARYARVVVACVVMAVLAGGSFAAVQVVMWRRQGRSSKRIAFYRSVRALIRLAVVQASGGCSVVVLLTPCRRGYG